MKKILSITILSLCLLGVSFLSFLSFFPWENLSWYGTEKLEKIFADQGISLRMSPPEVEGLFPPRMAIANITLESPLFQFRSSNIRGVLHPFQSLISSGLEGGFALGKGSLEGGGSRLLWDDGKGEVRAAPPFAGLTHFRLTGPFRAQGNISINTHTQRIAKASMTFRMPAEQEGLFRLLSTFMPLKRQSDGLWLLHR